jgi:hypothetical protein
MSTALPDDRQLLSNVTDAIADGRPVPWTDAEASSELAEISPLLRELRVLAALADVHRGIEASALSQSHTDRAQALDAFGSQPPPEWGSLRLIEEVGRGSFGAVYRARDLRLDRDVALKLIPSKLGAGTDSLATVAEGRLLAKLRHSNIITVYGADVIDGIVGIWMELLQGRTLHDGSCPRPRVANPGSSACTLQRGS